jgi:hypothetical protein
MEDDLLKILTDEERAILSPSSPGLGFLTDS